MAKHPQGCLRGGEDEHLSWTDTMVSDTNNGKLTMNNQCICGKVCKNNRGVKIHQARMKCLGGGEAAQCTGVQPGEVQEGPGPESPHSVQNLYVLQTNAPTNKFSRRWIKWPADSMTSLWEKFDEDVNQILEATVKGEADGKLQAMTTIIVSMGAKRFGKEEKSMRTPYSKNY